MFYADHIKGKNISTNGCTYIYTGKWYRENGLTWFEIKGNGKIMYINHPPIPN